MAKRPRQSRLIQAQSIRAVKIRPEIVMRTSCNLPPSNTSGVKCSVICKQLACVHYKYFIQTFRRLLILSPYLLFAVSLLVRAVLLVQFEVAILKYTSNRRHKDPPADPET